MSIKYMNAVWQNKSVSGSRRLVLLSLADNSNDDGVCWPSFDTIALRCNISRRYVISITRELEKDGLIRIKHRADDTGFYTSNIYQMNMDKIIAGGSEQGITRGSDAEFTRVVNNRSPGSEQGITRVVIQGSLKPSLNHQLTTTEAEELQLPQTKISTSKSIPAMLSRAAGLSAIPPSEYPRIEQITQLMEIHGVDKTEEALKNAAQAWRDTKNKNGRPYPITNMAWVDWAQAELDGGTSGPKVLTWAMMETMTEAQVQEYYAAGGVIPYE